MAPAQRENLESMGAEEGWEKQCDWMYRTNRSWRWYKSDEDGCIDELKLGLMIMNEGELKAVIRCLHESAETLYLHFPLLCQTAQNCTQLSFDQVT